VSGRHVPTRSDHSVRGHCPACGSETLFVGEGGWITCSFIGCPEPTALADTITDPHIHRHVVTFRDDDFVVRHPLSERHGTGIEDCPLHWHIAAMSGPPVRPGRYLAIPNGEEWTWQEVSS
jgi:hypothetical protein